MVRVRVKGGDRVRVTVRFWVNVRVETALAHGRRRSADSSDDG